MFKWGFQNWAGRSLFWHFPPNLQNTDKPSALLVWSCQCYKLRSKRLWEQTRIWFIFFGHDTSHPEFFSLSFYVCLLTNPFLICFDFVALLFFCAHTACISSLCRKSVALAVLPSHDLLSFLQGRLLCFKPGINTQMSNCSAFPSQAAIDLHLMRLMLRLMQDPQTVKMPNQV